ncbi:MAG: hypothetical protein OXE02_07685 [Chloroflexi bacterium]|nr:hypothetical protein [Chloroflexota bacterium]
MLSERIYRALLLAYPKEHRREFGEPMVQLFRDRMSRDGGGVGTLVVWTQCAVDLVRSAARERMETARTGAVRRNALKVLLLRDYTARTARTRKQVAVSLLLPCISVLLFAALASITSMIFPVSDRFGDAVFRSGLYIFGGMATLNLVLHGLVFRLRAGYDLKNALRAIAIYLPICIFVITVWLHLMPALLDTETPLFAVTWFEIALASWFGALMCVLSVSTHRVGFVPEPAPGVIAHPLYRKTERTISLGSLFGISLLMLSAL